MSRSSLVVVLLLGCVFGPGCRHLRSQLLDPVVADDTVTRQTLEALADTPLRQPDAARVTLETEGGIWLYSGEFEMQPPAAFTAAMVSTLGGVGLVVAWDEQGAHVHGAPAEIRGKAEGLPAALGLWLLGNCTEGTVLEAANGVAADCDAHGPEPGLTWRIWFDVERSLRLRGEVLDGDDLIADYICDAEGRCVVQDLLRGLAVRISPL